MQIRANPTIIGLFVLSSLLLGIAAIFYLGGDMLTDRSSKMILYFEGDVRGLQVGSPVTLRGVKVGQVEAMSISYNKKDQTFSIPVIISIDQVKLGFKRKYEGKRGKELLDSMIEQGLRAKIYSQSLVTGKMEVELTYQPDTPVRLMSNTTEYPEIPTIPSNMEKFSSALEELPLERMVRRGSEILDSIDKVLSESDITKLLNEMAQVIHRLDSITADLETTIPQLTSGSLEAVNESHRMVYELKTNLAPLTKEWTGLAKDSRRLIGNMDGQLSHALRRWDETLATGESAFEGVQASAASANEFLRNDSPLQTELVKALRELSASARSIRIMSEYLERHPEALLRGKQ